LMAPCLFFICKNPQTFYSYVEEVFNQIL